MPHADDSATPSIEAPVAAAGGRFWNGEPISRAEAARRFTLEARHQPQTELHLRADQAVAYRLVAQTLAYASKSGLVKVGFVSEPEGE